MQKKYYVFPNSSLDLISGYDLRALGALQAVYNLSDRDNLISLESIYFSYSGKDKLNYYTKKSIKESLERLYKIKLISKHGLNYIFNSKKLRESTPYVECSQEAFEKLVNSPDLLLHYLYIVRGRIYGLEINGKNPVICRKTINTFAAEEHTSEASIMRYNEKLQQLKLIYIGHNKFDGFNRDCNVYSLYEDRDCVDTYIGSYSNKDNSSANSDRSVSQRYNRYKKCPEKYSADQVKELYEAVLSYNKKMQNLGQKQPDYLKKMKDLSIFRLD